MTTKLVQVSYTPEFKRNLRALAKKYRSIRTDLQPLIEQLQAGQLPGDQVPGVSLTIFKVRLINSDLKKGKRAGYRCIYYLHTPDQIILVTIYSKTETSDIPTHRLQAILNQAEG